MRREPLFRPTLVASACLAAFIATVVLVVAQPLFMQGFRTGVSEWVLSVRADGLTTFFKMVTQLGSTWVITGITALVTLVLLNRSKYNEALFLIITVALVAALSQLFKYAVGETRPPIMGLMVPVHDPSFPSGHAACSLALYGSLLAIALLHVRPKVLRVLLFSVVVVLVGLIGASRVYLGAHWPIDVLGGWLLAGAMLASSHDALTSERFKKLLYRYLDNLRRGSNIPR